MSCYTYSIRQVKNDEIRTWKKLLRITISKHMLRTSKRRGLQHKPLMLSMNLHFSNYELQILSDFQAISEGIDFIIEKSCIRSSCDLILMLLT